MNQEETRVPQEIDGNRRGLGSGALLAGGGMRLGQVIGSTNRLGEVPQDRPVHYQDVFATLYHQLGIDVKTATIPDHSGRPQHLLDRHEPIRELIRSGRRKS